MSVSIFSAAIQGIEAQKVDVEVDSTPGIHSLTIVGLPDKAVQESKDRIGSSIRNSGFIAPGSKNRKIIVNLAPADLKKEGPSYDLPIAVGYLFETGQIKFNPEDTLFAGELSLDGSLKATNGVLAMAILAKKLGFKEFIIPSQNAEEAALVDGISVIPANKITDVVAHLDGTRKIKPFKLVKTDQNTFTSEHPFAFIRGQEAAKRALTIAAAGGHNILMYGPPGGGKTLLAKAFASILPPLSYDESIEVAKIYSSVGLFEKNMLISRPFRSPHHTTSPPAIVGGGTWPKPGEISLAHRGVLFLDELPEFPRNVLESLRQPLEDGVVTVSRASGSITLPAKFTLVAAMNPCPCGNYGDHKLSCSCSPFQVLKYRKKISGPLLDRMDIQINVSRETQTKNSENKGLNDDLLLKSISNAREIQKKRFLNSNLITNSEIGYKNIDNFCSVEEDAEKILQQVVESKSLSLRSYHKIKKLARTIADLENSENIKKNHIAEAISLRLNERSLAELS